VPTRASERGAGQIPRKARSSASRGPSTDTWHEAVAALDDASTGSERQAALLRFAAQATRELPGLSRHRVSLVAMLRNAALAEGVVGEFAGQPRTVIDEVELPTFDADDILAEAALRGEVRARVLDEELLTAAAVSWLLGSRSKNPRQYANGLRAKGVLVAVPHRNQFLYPAFQIDAEHGFVRPSVAEVNVALGAAEDPWGVASWWISPNGALGEERPVELLGDVTREQALVDVARALVENDAA